MFLPVSFDIKIAQLVTYVHGYIFILGAIFKTVISIYAQEKAAPLPSLEEILICNERTTVEEVCNYL